MSKNNISTEKKDVYQAITDKIVSHLENGTAPWVKPWSSSSCGARPLRSNGVPYQGINVLALWCESEEHGYLSPYWMTYKQAQELGGQVRKGEKSASVVCAKTFTKSEEAENGDQIEKVIPFLKSYAVFNADQIDGLDARYYAKAEPRERVIDRISEVDAFFSRLGADIRNGGARAYYRGDSDFVQMPDFEAFDDATSYYATLAHEITHWTKHLTRLDRDFGRKSWGDEGYAMEELVAELGAAFLCADLGLQSEPREDHASYIESWLKVLKDDKRAIFTAASHASRAVDFINQKATAQQLAA